MQLFIFGILTYNDGDTLTQHNNNIEVILNLDGCPNLRALSLAQNRIENLQPLRYQSKLNELWLQGKPR